MQAKPFLCDIMSCIAEPTFRIKLLKLTSMSTSGALRISRPKATVRDILLKCLFTECIMNLDSVRDKRGFVESLVEMTCKPQKDKQINISGKRLHKVSVLLCNICLSCNIGVGSAGLAAARQLSRHTGPPHK